MARKPDVRYICLYTDGNAARKVEPIAPWNTAKLPRMRKQKKIILRIDPVATVGIVVAVVMFLLMLVGVNRLNAARQEQAFMTQYVEMLRTDNSVLQDTYSAGYNLEEIEKMAMALGMVEKEEAEQILIAPEQPEEPEAPGFLDRFFLFLTGLFA